MIIIKSGNCRSVKVSRESIPILNEKTEEDLNEVQQYQNGNDAGSVETNTSPS